MWCLRGGSWLPIRSAVVRVSEHQVYAQRHGANPRLWIDSIMVSLSLAVFSRNVGRKRTLRRDALQMQGGCSRDACESYELLRREDTRLNAP
jgi:hypothetical protein